MQDEEKVLGTFSWSPLSSHQNCGKGEKGGVSLKTRARLRKLFEPSLMSRRYHRLEHARLRTPQSSHIVIMLARGAVGDSGSGTLY